MSFENFDIALCTRVDSAVLKRFTKLLTMVQTKLDIPYVNLIKFVIIELLVSIVLEPAWELIISRFAHRRIVRGQRVPLKSLAHSRTFPCSLSIGRLSSFFAVTLSLVVLGGSLASEYAVDAVSKLTEFEGNATVYALHAGRRADKIWTSDLKGDEREAAKKSSVATGRMAEFCHYLDSSTKSYHVNATFVESDVGEKSCVDNDPSMSYKLPSICTLTRRENHDFYCVLDKEGRFIKGERFNIERTLENDWRREVFANDRSIVLHMCSRVNCEKSNTTFGARERADSAHLYCPRDDRLKSTCLYVSTRWVLLSGFSTETGHPPSAEGTSTLVYRNMRGNKAFSPMTPFDLGVQAYYAVSFQQEIDYTTFEVPRNRDGVVIMLMLEGFGREADIRSVRDYRKDEIEIVTEIRLLLFIPLLIATLALVTGAAIGLVLQPKRTMIFQPPVSMEQLMACARARDSGAQHDHAFGHPNQKLVMGIVKDNYGLQRFSVDALNTEEYNSSLGWSRQDN